MELEHFVRISKYAGERFDLVQAGGGNTSVKLEDGTMLIKASGYLLSDVEKDNGYVKVDTRKIKDIVKNEKLLKAEKKREKESVAATLVKDATLSAGSRPSIETLLHSFLRKYTLHTHPLVVNMIVNKPNWKELLQSIFTGEEIALVHYQTPGVELAIELNKEIQKFPHIPQLIFLQNHGLIVSSDDAEEIDKLTNHVVNKVEKYLKVDMERYKLVNSISKLMHACHPDSSIAYLSEDIQINQILASNKQVFYALPFCPDKLVFCGFVAVELDSLLDVKSIRKYKDSYFELPKVIIYKDHLFVIAKNIKKAKEIEEVLKFHVMALNSPHASNINYLPMDELAYLSNWEAEEYRKKL